MYNNNLTEESDKIELRSEEVQEILGTPPSWIVRWGITLVFLTLVILGVMGWVIKYPDIIKAPIMILTQNPPTIVIARADGNIVKLMVKEKEQVTQGQLLGVIQNSSKYEDVLALSDEITKVQQFDDTDFYGYKPITTYQLGDLQGEYATFIQTFEGYTYTINGNYSSVNISQLSEQINNLKKAKGLINLTLNKANEKIRNIGIEFKNAQKLYSGGAISQLELKELRNKQLAAEAETDRLGQELNSKDLEINNVKSKIIEIKQNTAQGNSDRYVKLRESVNNLRASLDKWKQIYLFNAPITGQVSFYSKIFSENQFVKAGDEILAVVPSDSTKVQHIIGKVVMPMTGTGKVKEGQKVIISLDSYPYQEYGTLSGVVVNKSLIPKENNLMLQIQMPDTLITSYHKKIKFEQLLQGQAEIVTENRRFLERVFDKFLSMFKKY